MHRRTRVGLAVAVLAFVMVLVLASTAMAGTITTRIAPRHVTLYGQTYNVIAPTQVYVYGPSNNYWTYRCGGSALPVGVPFVCWDRQHSFTGAPTGAYRVRFVTTPTYGIGYHDWSWYFSTWWLGPNYTVNYTSGD